MRKPKVVCFRYRRHNDIYVSNVSVSSDVLLSILDAFPDKKIIVLIEADENYVQTISSMGKNIGIAELMPRSHMLRFLAACEKTELHYLLNQVNLDNLEGVFITSVNDDVVPDEVICSLDYIASSMVKNGISDISISIDFPENQMVISLTKEKYEVMLKNKICGIFGK